MTSTDRSLSVAEGTAQYPEHPTHVTDYSLLEEYTCQYFFDSCAKEGTAPRCNMN